jgi:hypothetical protein
MSIIVRSALLMREWSQARSNGTTSVRWVVLTKIPAWNPRVTGTANHLVSQSDPVSSQTSFVCTTDICQTTTDRPIKDRLVALRDRQQVNHTIKIALRMKGGAMPRRECGRLRRPGAEVQA